MRHAIAIALLLAACADDPPPSGPAITSQVDYHEIPAQPAQQLDLLVVIDNTAAMAPYQDRIAVVPTMIDAVVARVYHGLTNVHVAVTTNGGAIGSVLSDVTAWDGTHATSFQGSLADALAPLVSVGTSNTGPSQPLAAMHSALTTPQGFLRDNAYLAVVTITASDDASPAFDYVTFLKGLKTDPANVIVSGVYPQPSGTLDAFYAAFPNRNTVVSIDNGEYSPAFEQIGQLYRTTLGAPCYTPPLDIDPVTPGDQFECDVSAWDEGIELATLPACNGADPTTGTCWEYQSYPGCPAGTAFFHMRGLWSLFHPTIHIQCVVK